MVYLQSGDIFWSFPSEHYNWSYKADEYEQLGWEEWEISLLYRDWQTISLEHDLTVKYCIMEMEN